VNELVTLSSQIRVFCVVCIGFITPTLSGGVVAGQRLSLGPLEAVLDSTITYGIAWRVGGPAEETKTDGGNPFFESGDIVSNRISGTHELQFNVGENLGAFFRATYFYDNANDDLDPTVPGIIDARQSDKYSVNDLALLDAYLFKSIDVPFGTLVARYGSQVISWGESTFIGGSLNDINTLDVTKARGAGAELKQALVPTRSIYLNLMTGLGVSLEAFYLLDFSQVRLDPAGTFWNSSAATADGGLSLGPLTRAKNNFARESGQFGAAIRYFADWLNAGTELAVYYHNLHSHNPYLSGIGGAKYFLDYPEDIETWGSSLNTRMGGWAVSGEWSHRRNEPIQLTDFFFGALTAPLGDVVEGFGRVRRDQIQGTFQRVVTPRLIRADTGSILVEFGYSNLGNRPLTRFVPVTDDAWGYQLSTNATYNRAIGIINLTPRVAFRHDVNGIAGPFLESRRTITLGVDWSYLITLTGSFEINHGWGGTSHRNNLTGGRVRGDADRSWVAATISYQF
jgi:hypothetical protein